MKWLQSLIPEHIQHLIPYASARRDSVVGEVWLNANENPSVPGLQDQPWKLNRYPDFQPEPLLKTYAGYAGVAQDQLLVTRGIDEGIVLLMSTFCTVGVDQVVYTPPTYGLYKIAAETQGVTALSVPLTKDFQLDVELIETIMSNPRTGASAVSASRKYPDIELAEMSIPNCRTKTSASSAISPRPKLIFLCSPNNPTGNLLKRSDVLKVLESSREKALVILDEAYIEFIPEASFAGLIQDYPNLVILRTLSKAFGLAGLRCGFVMANPEIIQTLRKVIAPYPIPSPVVDLATQAFSETGIARMNRAVQDIVATRTSMEQQLLELTFVKQIFVGHANFVLMEVVDVPKLMSFLAQKGIIIRDQSFQTGLENCVRITVGSQDEIQSLFQALQEFEVCK